MAQEFKNIVLIGGSGNLGALVLRELQATNKFNVTVLSRASSSSTFPAGVKVVKSDYSEDSLVEIFRGQDAVIATLTTTASGDQYPILNAAAKAGVKRFIPSEFGINSTNKRAGELTPIASKKLEVTDHIRKLSKEYPQFSYTNISTGPFFDWGLINGFLGADLSNHTFTLWDDGTRPFSVTLVSSIARAVVRILLHTPSSETSNRHLFISSFEITQSQLLQALEHATNSEWTVTRVTTAQQIEEGKEKLASGDAAGGFKNLTLAATYERSDIGSDFKNEEKKDFVNGLLGMPTPDLEEITKKVVESGKVLD
ncbi:MAG: hypothetical protein M4579_005818 [Chaenotheca gracillima]|nr:MAG: hypothetical protein M4579_005818 [Chaenotheca gracillima]